MITGVAEVRNKPVYTHKGVYLGVVDDLVVDLRTRQIDAWAVVQTNQVLVEGGAPVLVPFRWTKGVGDIILLRHFPEKVSIAQEQPKKKKMRVLRNPWGDHGVSRRAWK